MSREAHVRICERLGSMIPVDSTNDFYSSEIFGSPDCWVCERKKCDIDCSELHGAQEKLHGPKVLGERVPCVYSRKG